MSAAASASGPLNGGRVYVHTVRAREQKSPLLELLATAYPHSSRDEWAAHVEAGRVLVLGVAASAGDRLREGAVIEYHRPPWREPVADLDRIRVLHSDTSLLVLAKPSGLPVLPSEVYWENTVLAALRRAYPPEHTDPPRPVHRLGVDTSGVLLCATSSAARAALSRSLAERQVTKIYRALASGLVERDEFEIECPIGPLPHASWGGSVAGAVPGGGGGAKHAHSIVKVLRRDEAGQRTLVEVRIPTGRPHQIRIHMAYAGHPLVGDPLYDAGGVPKTSLLVVEGAEESGRERPPLPRDGGYLLHAWRASLPHPASGERMSFETPPPRALCLPGESTAEEADEAAANRGETGLAVLGAAALAAEKGEVEGDCPPAKLLPDAGLGNGKPKRAREEGGEEEGKEA